MGGSTPSLSLRRLVRYVVGALMAATVLAGCATTDGSGVPESIQRAATASPAPAASGGSVRATRSGEIPSVGAPVAAPQMPVYTADLDYLAEQRAPEPVRLTVADLGIDMDVTDVGLLRDGTLEIPETAAVAGWYRAMAAPGADDGIALIAAHVDSPTGLGPFAALQDVSEGAEVDVELEDGATARYRVSAIEQTSKDTVDFERILDGSLGHHLVLVTCGGEFNWSTRHYDDNVIVWAERVND